MTITFVSNYINHHQIPMAEELFAMLGEDYHFIETQPMEEERVNMGWDTKTSTLPYLIRFYDEPDRSRLLIRDSDVVVFGGCDDESYISDRLAAKKPVIRVSERLYKSGQWKAVSPRGLIKKYKDHTSHKKDPVILLCAGAYVPSDFNIVKAYPGKMYRWGYFPPFAKQNIESLLEDKRNEIPQILWAGRFIDWKHPEAAIYVAKRLKAEGIAFKLTMIGGGDMEAELKQSVKDLHLEEEVEFVGYKSPVEVRQYMEKSHIFLFTSDYLEGWGAVLNEAMNSGCAVVGNLATGAVPYLIEDGVNGFTYANKDLEALYSKTRLLLMNEVIRQSIGRKAYETIEEIWNCKVAARQIIRLSQELLGLESEENPLVGPGSKAKVIPVRKMQTAIQKHMV